MMEAVVGFLWIAGERTRTGFFQLFFVFGVPS